MPVNENDFLPEGSTIVVDGVEYQLNNLLGSGAFAVVRDATVLSDSSSEKWAVKCQIIFDQEKLNQAATPEIRKALEVFFKKREEDSEKEYQISYLMGLASNFGTFTRDNKKYHHVVMQNLGGPELLDIIKQNQKKRKSKQYSVDREVLFLNQYLQLMNQLEALHASGHIHRDIKPQNILQSPNGLRLVDFGVSISTTADQIQNGFLYSAAGTPDYFPPEHPKPPYPEGFPKLLYSEKTDIYSLAKSMKEYYESSFQPHPEIVDFLKKQMDKDPKKRISVAESKKWLMHRLEKNLQSDTKAHKKTQQSIKPETVYQNFSKILSVLQKNHHHHLVHGSINPQNMRLDFTNPENACLAHYAKGLECTGVSKLDMAKFEGSPPSLEQDLTDFLDTMTLVLKEQNLLTPEKEAQIEALRNMDTTISIYDIQKMLTDFKNEDWQAFKEKNGQEATHLAVWKNIQKSYGQLYAKHSDDHSPSYLGVISTRIFSYDPARPDQSGIYPNILLQSHPVTELNQIINDVLQFIESTELLLEELEFDTKDYAHDLEKLKNFYGSNKNPADINDPDYIEQPDIFMHFGITEDDDPLQTFIEQMVKKLDLKQKPLVFSRKNSPDEPRPAPKKN